MVSMPRYRMALAVLLMLGMAVAFCAQLAMRLSERVEIDATTSFELERRDIASVLTRSDALSAFEVILVTRAGARHKLERIYANWKQLCGTLGA